VLGGTSLNGVGNDVLGAHGGGFARFGLEPFDQVGGIAPRVPFHLLEQKVARFVRAEAGHALQLPLPIRDELLDLRRGGRRPLLVGGHRFFAAPKILFDPVGCGQRSASARVLSAGPVESHEFLTPLARLLSASAASRAPSRELRGPLPFEAFRRRARPVEGSIRSLLAFLTAPSAVRCSKPRPR
jgi:hypothetical protein